MSGRIRAGKRGGNIFKKNRMFHVGKKLKIMFTKI